MRNLACAIEFIVKARLPSIFSPWLSGRPAHEHTGGRCPAGRGSVKLTHIEHSIEPGNEL
jgi:hypothetical protein